MIDKFFNWCLTLTIYNCVTLILIYSISILLNAIIEPQIILYIVNNIDLKNVEYL